MILKRLKLALFSFLGLIALCLIWYGIQRGLAGGRQVRVFELEPLVPPSSSHSELKVGAYNIAHGRGGKLGESNWSSEIRKKGEAHLQRIADQIRLTDLDVVILNEVDFDANWSGGFDHARYIAEHSGFPYVAELTNIDIDLPFFNLRFGNAILSKHPFEHVASIELPPVKWWEPYLAGRKNALEATIIHNGEAISFIAIHIETRSQEVRLSSVSTLTDHIQTSDTPYILLGDFNSQRTKNSSTAIDQLIEQHGFKTDVNVANWHTFPSVKPDRGIDWILVPPSLSIHSTRAIPSDLSDHLMITSEISW